MNKLILNDILAQQNATNLLSGVNQWVNIKLITEYFKNQEKEGNVLFNDVYVYMASKNKTIQWVMKNNYKLNIITIRWIKMLQMLQLWMLQVLPMVSVSPWSCVTMCSSWSALSERSALSRITFEYFSYTQTQRAVLLNFTPPYHTYKTVNITSPSSTSTHKHRERSC